MDAGTTFGGMGSSREMLIAAIAEPALLMVFFAIAMTAASTNLVTIINQLTTNNLWIQPSRLFAALGFILVALAETGRIPIDNPATHLELTMIHEAMILEYSGRHLALIEWAAQIKFAIYAILLVNLFFPWGVMPGIDGLNMSWNVFIMMIKLTTLMIILGLTESTLAKLRLFRAPYLLNFAFVFGLLAILIHMIIEGN